MAVIMGKAFPSLLATRGLQQRRQSGACKSAQPPSSPSSSPCQGLSSSRCPSPAPSSCFPLPAHSHRSSSSSSSLSRGLSQSALFLVSVFQVALLAALLMPSSTVSAAGLRTANSPFRFVTRSDPAQSRRDESALLKLLQESSGGAPKKRSNYVDLQCRGMYDQGILTQLERICEDCYNLYKDAEVHGYCRMDCFSTQTFRQCLQSLLLEKESDFYLELVEIIGKKKR